MSNKNKQTIFGKVAKSLMLATVSTALMVGAIQFQSTVSENKDAKAAGTNNANLIIGKVDTGTVIELSVCLQNTGDNIRLANASTWFNFNNSELTPSPAIVQSGIYSSANGYGTLKIQQVLPAPVTGQTSETWTVRTDYLGDGVTQG